MTEKEACNDLGIPLDTYITSKACVYSDGKPSACNEVEKKNDAYLCKDALAMEKHVSSVYDMSVFEFSSPTLRDTLAHIQKEEQNHGEKLYNYLSCNNMYS